jgi:hypothetical protein
MTLIITHGHHYNGADPGHTPEGLAQIRRIAESLNLPIEMVIRGTGRRFEEMKQPLYDAGKIGNDTPARVSPFCGGAEYFDPPKTVILPNGAPCPTREYFGLASGLLGFDPWKFVNAFPDDTIFLAGDELLMALGEKKPAKGALYSLDPADRVCHLISQG